MVDPIYPYVTLFRQGCTLGHQDVMIGSVPEEVQPLWRTPGVPVAAADTGRHNKLALSLTICSQLDLQGDSAELSVAPCCCVCPAASITYGNMRGVLKMCLWINTVVRIVSS